MVNYRRPDAPPTPADRACNDVITMMIYMQFKHRSPVETSLSSSPSLPKESCDEQAAGKDRALLCLMPGAKFGI